MASHLHSRHHHRSSNNVVGKNDANNKKPNHQQTPNNHHHHHQRRLGRDRPLLLELVQRIILSTMGVITIAVVFACLIYYFFVSSSSQTTTTQQQYDNEGVRRRDDSISSSSSPSPPPPACQMRPYRFRTNNLINPLAIEDDKPVFSWALELIEQEHDNNNKSTSPTPINHYQTAYRIICTELLSGGGETEEDGGAVLWDSGKVYSRETLQIEYDGRALQSLQRIQWQIQIWDQNDQECVTTSANKNNNIQWPFFETGLLDEESWQDAEWIARYPITNDAAASSNSFRANASLCDMMNETLPANQSPRFKTQLILEEEYETIRAYIVGLGYYQLYINGKRVGDSHFDPGWTTYNQRVFYSTYNVTNHFLAGNDNNSLDEQRIHVIAIELGNGWWNPLPIHLWNNPKLNMRHNLVTEQAFTTSQPMFKLQIFGWKKKKRERDGDGSVVVESILKTTTSKTDFKWVASGSPTLFHNIFLGEIYDTRLESLYRHWKTSTTVTDGIIWKPVVSANHQGNKLGKLQAQSIPPIRRQHEEALKTSLLSIHSDKQKTNTNIVVYDTGINHAGNCRIRLYHAPPRDQEQTPTSLLEGQRITLMYGELLYKNGTVNGRTAVVGQIKPNQVPKSAGPCQPDMAYQQDVIILSGSGRSRRGSGTTDNNNNDQQPQVLVDWTPSCSWHGFRYIQVTLPQSIDAKHDLRIDCYKMRTDMELITTNFTTSDSWVTNVLRPLVRNTFDSNLMSVLSDCPHRERFGYGGDALGAGEAGLSIYDWSSFLRKRVVDYNDAQRTTTGQRQRHHDKEEDQQKLTGFTETAPYTGIADKGLGYGTGPIGWQNFQPEALLWLYKYYGDIKTMKQSFPHTKAYIDLLDDDKQPTQEGIQNGLGDWMPVDKTNVNYTGLGFQRMSYLAFANITELLGMSPDIALKYRQKATEITKQINNRFLVSDTTTTSNSITNMIKSWLFGGGGGGDDDDGGGQIGDYLVGTIKKKIQGGEEEEDEVRTTVVRTGNITQTGQAMALFNGFLDETSAHLKQQVLQRLVENVRSSSYIDRACRCDINTSSFQPECEKARGGPGPHMTAGLFGVKWFLMALADGGHNDLAYDVVTTKSYPGLRWMTNNPFANATTIWESYFFSDDTYSHNHPMFGSTEVWLLQSVVGIQPHPSARGMDHVLIRPNPPSQLQHASASFQSPRGIISVSWRKTRKQTDQGDGTTSWNFKLEVTIPPNCQATVHVPVSRRTDRRVHVVHNGKTADVGRWVPSWASILSTNEEEEDDRHHHDGSFVINIGSGRHEFESVLFVFGTQTSAEQ